MEWRPRAAEARRLLDEEGETEKFAGGRDLRGFIRGWDPSLDRMFEENRSQADLPTQAEEAKRVAEAPRRITGWIIEGRRAVAQPGATLSGLAKAITGHASDWHVLPFKRDPRSLREGATVDILPLLLKAEGLKN